MFSLYINTPIKWCNTTIFIFQSICSMFKHFETYSAKAMDKHDDAEGVVRTVLGSTHFSFCWQY
jgi:hypothetical protein